MGRVVRAIGAVGLEVSSAIFEEGLNQLGFLRLLPLCKKKMTRVWGRLVVNGSCCDDAAGSGKAPEVPS